MGKRTEKIAIEQGMWLVEVENLASVVKDVKTEMDRMFALWDAVRNQLDCGLMSSLFWQSKRLMRRVQWLEKTQSGWRTSWRRFRRRILGWES